MAVALLTRSTRSTTLRSRVSGMKPAPIPWILCGPGFSSWPASFCVITGLSSGSTATLRIGLLLTCLMYRETPVMVPPVPTPRTNTSILPSVSSQISGPVVLKWMSGLAGFLNC